ncbi:MAG: DUF4279 domain-containing protein [Clostridia bacterium]|nr:DUF4279 domain-containing protein [Clostridia bacterium]
MHKCHTYFRITGDIDPDFISYALGASPDKFIKKGTRLPISNRVTENDDYIIGYNDNYNVDINEMIRVTLGDIIDKAELLCKMRVQMHYEYYLVVVPKIESDSDEPSPILSLDKDIIEFLYKSGAQHDLDYYIY